MVTTNFGDIRGCLHEPRPSVGYLTGILSRYNDNLPPEEVLLYVKNKLGYIPSSYWSGANDKHNYALKSHRFQSKQPLRAYVKIGNYEGELLWLTKAESNVQEVCNIFRIEAFEKAWLPWANTLPDNQNVLEATERLKLYFEHAPNYTYHEGALRACHKAVQRIKITHDVRNSIYVMISRSLSQMMNCTFPPIMTKPSLEELDKIFLTSFGHDNIKLQERHRI